MKKLAWLGFDGSRVWSSARGCGRQLFADVGNRARIARRKSRCSGAECAFTTVACSIVALALFAGAAMGQPAPTAQRELLLLDGTPGHWLAQPGISVDSGPAGSNVVLTNPGSIFTNVNLPATTENLLVAVDRSDTDRGAIESLIEDAHGWTRRHGLNIPQGKGPKDACQRIDPNVLHTGGWSWRVGFFHSKPVGPFQFHGLRFEAQERRELAGHAVKWGIGPVKITYTPDDSQWFYADLQPKTVALSSGQAPPLTLRIANLGTRDRTFTLSARAMSRNLEPLTGAAATAMGRVELKAGEMKQIPIPLPLPLLGRYAVQYSAKSGDGDATADDEVAVVNALDKADGYRDWVAHRRTFSVPNRRPTGARSLTRAGKPAAPLQVKIVQADNGISSVPIFPIGARNPESGSASAAPSGRFSVWCSQLSPAWLIHCADPRLALFTGSDAAGLGGPTHVAFATAEGTRVLSVGDTLDAKAMGAMTQSWLLVWWQGAPGWSVWDAPHLVCLQHRPSALALTKNGVSVSFAGPAGYASTLPLFGYAKLPQKAAWDTKPDQFHFPADAKSWPPEQLHSWTWDKALPPLVADRCRHWSQLLLRYPCDVHEQFTVARDGQVKVRDQYDYVSYEDDWHTPASSLAPLSPTIAAAKLAGFPLTIDAGYADLQYPTLFGPYGGAPGSSISYTLEVGPYLTETAEPNLTTPPDATTPARRAQAAMLQSAITSDSTAENRMWDWNDENFVWNMQGADLREPAYWTGYTDAPSRQDRKAWLQARVLHTLLNDKHYGLDERNAVGLDRRYCDGPGIGNWGSGDWGDSGKLGTDMIWDAWIYAYNTGDYQTIADKWDLLCSLNVTPVTMTWLGVGRGAIAEMGDEASPMLGLARLAYAVGDRETYAAAAYWYARELVNQCVKEGGLTEWREQFAPWQKGIELPTETGTNIWGSNASWQGGGFITTLGGENQWNNFYVRLDDIDTLRFQREHATALPRRVDQRADAANSAGNYTVYYLRTVILGQDPARAAADFLAPRPTKPGAKPRHESLPDSYIFRVSQAEHEFAPKRRTLIGPEAPASIADDGFAQEQMNQMGCAMVNPSDMSGNRATIHWFHYQPPHKVPGPNGDQWDFGTIAPPDLSPTQAPARQDIGGVAALFTWP